MGVKSGRHPPPLYSLPRGEGIILKSEKKILRMKNVRAYAFSATLRGKSGPCGAAKEQKFYKGREVIHSPGATLLVERRRSGAMDNFHLQKIY